MHPGGTTTLRMIVGASAPETEDQRLPPFDLLRVLELEAEIAGEEASNAARLVREQAAQQDPPVLLGEPGQARVKLGERLQIEVGEDQAVASVDRGCRAVLDEDPRLETVARHVLAADLHCQ